MDDKIILDRESFKALAAESRIRILKLLHQRKHMQAELAGALDMSLPAVKEHLDALEKAGLILRKDEGRKWKYYELTQKGKAVLDPEQKRIWIVLSLFIISVAGGIAAYGRVLLSDYLNPAGVALAKSAELAESTAGDATMMTIPAAAQDGVPWALIVYGVWLALLLIMFLYSYIRRRSYAGRYLTKS
ncbi:winged helix-turn-helix transcriptional regulator [Candidatus Woesearchaeota archaeon]|nr:winged helix-turn-helix transcriptional regulator [Candidatus Woesearchaeota archaeon]